MLSFIQLSALSSLLLAMTSQAQTPQQHVVPTFTLDEIQHGYRLPELSQVLKTTGLFAVKNSPRGASQSRVAAMNGLCQCLSSFSSSSPSAQLENLDSIVLQDGLTRRTTIATATVGQHHPLPFEAGLDQVCGPDTIHAMETVRDEVAEVSHAVVHSLDQLLGIGRNGPLMESKFGSTYETMTSIVDSANHLEHFHHYSRAASAPNTEKTREWHTDAGLFLTFLPAHDCPSSGMRNDDSFWVQLPGGEQASAYFEPGSVAVMMGAGAEHWLQKSFSPAPTKLKATRHAVKMDHSTSRVWYGMMHLVPEDSVIQENPKRTFGEMRENMKVSSAKGALDDETIAIGCGTGLLEEPFLQEDASIASPYSRRRLQMVEGPGACNNVTNFFCWMSCLEIPSYQQAEAYIQDGNGLYCLDPAILATTGNNIGAAMEPCGPLDMNSNCAGIWTRESPSIPGWPVEYNSSFVYEEKYCYSGTSMYMDGFHWIHDTTCVIYLFPDWVLNTEAKFIIACFGTIFFGMMVEVIIYRRRKSMVNFEAGNKRLFASAAFYGLQIGMGYLVMLVVMTFSIPLFLCCVGGLTLGHMIFNARDSVMNRLERNKKVKEEEQGTQETTHTLAKGGEEGDSSKASTESPKEPELSPCCGPPAEEEKPKPKKSADLEVPEGVTPCCQNSLDVF